MKKETILKKIKELERSKKIIPSFINFSNREIMVRLMDEIDNKIRTYKERLK